MSGQIIGLQEWFETPPGRYLLAWEQARFDEAVADVFGYHALQLGLPACRACATTACRTAGWPMDDPACATGKAALMTDFAALPFAEASLDLVLLPHALELSPDPHATLREVERVLVPEGSVVICGFNPASLWGMRQRRARLYRRLGIGELYLPDAGEFIGFWRHARLAQAAELRSRVGALRLLPAGGRQRGLAQPLRLDGPRGRSAGGRSSGRLFPGGGQTRTRHAAHGSLEAAKARTTAPVPVANRQGHHRDLKQFRNRNSRMRKNRLNKSKSTPTAPARATPAPAAGAHGSSRGPFEKELFGGELGTTNNRMEMMAVIQGLGALKRPCQVTALPGQPVRAARASPNGCRGWKARAGARPPRSR
jgi:SAM-dependent methyltransferase